MKRFKKFLSESMDTLLPYDRVKDEKQDDMRHVHHEISVPDGSTVTVEKRTDSEPSSSVSQTMMRRDTKSIVRWQRE